MQTYARFINLANHLIFSKNDFWNIFQYSKMCSGFQFMNIVYGFDMISQTSGSSFTLTIKGRKSIITLWKIPLDIHLFQVRICDSMLRPELEFRVRDSWITNQFLDPTNQTKELKNFHFSQTVSSKCNNFKFKEWSWTMKDKNSVNYLVIH